MKQLMKKEKFERHPSLPCIKSNEERKDEEA